MGHSWLSFPYVHYADRMVAALCLKGCLVWLRVYLDIVPVLSLDTYHTYFPSFLPFLFSLVHNPSLGNLQSVNVGKKIWGTKIEDGTQFSVPADTQGYILWGPPGHCW